MNNISPSHKEIQEIFNHSTEIQKLVFIDTLGDLIKWIIIPNTSPSKKIPESMYIDPMIKDFTSGFLKDANFKSIQEYNNFAIEVRKFLFWERDLWTRKCGLFIITKDKTKLPKNIKEYYGIIGKDELDEIYHNRKLFFRNLINEKIIEIFHSENEEFNSICDEFIESISKIDEKNKRTLQNLTKIKDPIFRNYITRLNMDFWAESIKIQFEKFFNEMELESFFWDKEELNNLFHILSWKTMELKQEFSFNENSRELIYGWIKPHVFKNGKNRHIIIQMAFEIEKSKPIDFVDVIEKIEGLNVSDIKDFDIKKKNLNTTILEINELIEKKYKVKEFFRVKDRAYYRQY